MLEEGLVVVALTGDAADAFGAGFVGEGDTAEEAVGEVFAVEVACGIGGGAEGDVDAEDGVSGDAVGGSPQGACAALHIVDVADGLADLTVAAAHTVGHFDLWEVEILGACALFFDSHGVLEEGCIGEVGRREPEGDVGALGFFLVGAASLHLSLPFGEALIFFLVVGTEGAHNSFDEVRELRLTDA